MTQLENMVVLLIFIKCYRSRYFGYVINSSRKPFKRFADDLSTIVPNVAKSFEWNDDFTTLTFTLRKGHKWSNGEPFCGKRY